VNTTLHRYKDQIVNAAQGYNRRLNREPYKTREYKMQSDWWSKQLVNIFTIWPLRVKQMFSSGLTRSSLAYIAQKPICMPPFRSCRIWLTLVRSMANPGLEVRSYGNEILLNSPDSRTTTLSSLNNSVQFSSVFYFILMCCIDSRTANYRFSTQET
jgi:hypothetical protein